ncbi:hypothetical protein Pmar_PMAR028385 [Perkinsus marinus ATCC 50983]|uniref:Uncharacterized protein n=1 Tax=Perkinsus marinus (strain ATCC 50983 / TXsc) TaxID=423536 RepID=C5KBP1_PERM5|nr:hypothetical protein Pmar_PMAR028385 [Perkinsus marinus ATCC 50983]EER18111.1 hypothetical protein Pmar_PMAR028385 [Perkinsus marinus ATCC 50983]|eukprot:XP_002786315.1 hypothetical protein Pmar_PMAR028385 [Perkinsus marinus ATCC 50983]
MSVPGEEKETKGIRKVINLYVAQWCSFDNIPLLVKASDILPSQPCRAPSIQGHGDV